MEVEYSFKNVSATRNFLMCVYPFPNTSQEYFQTTQHLKYERAFCKQILYLNTQADIRTLTWQYFR